jgi:hypothetical protein
MKTDPDIAILLRTLEKMGVEIRRGSFDAAGGLVRMEDRYILFLRNNASPASEKESYLDAIRKMRPAAVHVPPRVRELLGEDDWETDKGDGNG